MSDTFDIAPELRELLGDIASDESARLLRLSPRQVQAVLYERDAKACASAPFLGNAERKLLEAYREESARILHLYAELLRAENPPDPFHHTGDCVTPVPDARSVKNRARRVVQDPRFSVFDEDTRRILDHCIAGPHPRTTEAVAAASVRISPNLKARVSLVVDQVVISPQAQAPALELDQLIRECPYSDLSSYAHEALAWCAYQRGDFRRASNSYQAAASPAEARALPLLSWLTSAIAARDRVAAERALEQVDAYVGETHPGLDYFLRRMDAPGVRIPLRSAWGAESSMWNLVDKAGPVSRRIIDVLSAGS